MKTPSMQLMGNAAQSRSSKVLTMALAVYALSCRGASGRSSGAGPSEAAIPTPPAVGSAAIAPSGRASPVAIPLPGGEGGIGFDDLGFGRRQKMVLVPAGRTGTLCLIDPSTRAVTAIKGFSVAEQSVKGHGQGTTSADEGPNLLFAVDRTTKLLHAVDPTQGKVVASTPIAGSPDYVRFVETTGEVWVTEPDEERIEIFSLASGGAPKLLHVAFIKIAGGPESLVVDGKRQWAFTHLWKDVTVVIDLRARAILGKWKNGCEGSRGIALDEARGHLFVGCTEGKVVSLDVDHEGRSIASVPTGKGVDIIAYSPERRHVYAPGATSATMTTIDVAETGELRAIGTVPTAQGAHCVTADDRGGVWVCDPERGQLLFFQDGG